MRNITGSPVESGDFFPRPRDLGRLERELKNKANILLTAPRRVGKTSLVLELCRREREAGRSAVFVNVEGCHDELGFAEKLVDGLSSEALHPEILERALLAFRKVRQAFGGTKMGAAGVNLEVKSDDPEHGTLGRTLESILRKIEAGDTQLLLVIDEMPELLLALGREEEKGAERVNHLLHWLRAMRQTYRNQVRWIFLGSIGLDTFVDDRNLRKTINDLTPLNMEAFTAREATEFLLQLSGDNGMSFSDEETSYIIGKLGWPLPHHLQLIFHAMVECGSVDSGTSAVDTAFNHLLQPHCLSQFDTWRQRLGEQFGPSDAKLAKDVLHHLCQHLGGRSRAQIFDALMAVRQSADASVIDEQFLRLLLMLQRDGYIVEADERYAFRSFLLREFWYRREVR